MTATAVASNRILDHPRGLYVLFFSEMWERFGFYGLRALLVLYMTKYLIFSDTKLYGIYAAYMALVYTTPIIGGILADRLLGNRRAIVIGAVLIALGHFMLMTLDINMFYMGLAFLISGTGFFKANISSLVGQLYEQGDPRLDAGFTLFYMGINIGALASSLIVGLVGELYGWSYAFGLSGIGMLLGLMTFLYGMQFLEGKGAMPEQSPAKLQMFSITLEQVTYVLAFILTPVIAILVYQHQWFDIFLPIVGVIVFAYVLFLAFTGEAKERNALLVILVLMFFHTAFFALFEQAGCSVNLFTDRNVDRVFWGYKIPTPQFQALNPAFIIMLAPLIAWMWVALGRRNLDPYPPMKFVFGLICVGLGFGALIMGIKTADQSGLTSMYWLVLAYFIHTVGELSMMPVGLSMVTKLAPARILSMMMGIWFLSVAFGEYLTGVFAKLAAVTTHAGQVVDVKSSLVIYGNAFTFAMYFAWVMAAILVLISPFLNRIFAKLEAEVPKN